MRICADDTIAAISTPIGEGGIGIVRLSGRGAVKIASRIFFSRDGDKPAKFKSHSVHYGYIVNGKKQRVDEVLLTVMKAPRTYTREDTVEINCHGGIVALRKVMELTFKHGARPAEPGEFTKRAFLNGRIDLSQAEAVLDVIRAKTEEGLRVSLDQLEGELSKEIKLARNGIMDMCADIEALMDFPEEDVTKNTITCWLKGIKGSKIKLEKLLDTYHDGAILKEGIVAVICGKPNVGKSSLLNLLLKKNRAIVTHIPGTTRDPIEDIAGIKGIPIRLVDTAGIGQGKGIVEKEGVRRSHMHLSRADLVLCVLDGSEKLTNEDKAILSRIKARSIIVVINKCDLKMKLNREEIKRIAKQEDILNISCLSKIGIDKLENRIYNKIWSGKVHSSDEVMVTNMRHKINIEGAVNALSRAARNLKRRLSIEFLAADLRESAYLLGKITGEEYTEDVLDIIFSRFCIGK